MEKIRIRKIDVTPDEFFARIEKILEVGEKAYGKWRGVSVKLVCSSLGIKELDLWELRFDNADIFKEKFIVFSDDSTGPTTKKLIKATTWNDPSKPKPKNDVEFRY
jgi:hypothetical protein